MEGLEVVEVVMTDYYHYGRLLTELWQAGEGFTLVEHDIVPWPGAIVDLKSCLHECCAFEYPNGIMHAEPRSGWCTSLGCIRFSDELVQRIPCDGAWQNRGWDELDGAVFGTLAKWDVDIHIHTPPVAHVKARSLRLRRVEHPR